MQFMHWNWRDLNEAPETMIKVIIEMINEVNAAQSKG